MANFSQFPHWFKHLSAFDDTSNNLSNIDASASPPGHRNRSHFNMSHWRNNSTGKKTTAVNIALGLPGLFATFTRPQAKKLQILSISSSTTSILLCLFVFYFIFLMDRRKKFFRHDLLLYLITCDFFKALILLIFPVSALTHDTIYFVSSFYNTLGWFTAWAIEGADIAIVVFAIHFALLIFKPNLKWKNTHTNNYEGGLFKIRLFIWLTAVLLPMVMASLAFIDFNTYNVSLLDTYTNLITNDTYSYTEYQARKGGYKPLGMWCYLPPNPVYYKLFLSWGPRYFFILLIVVLYLSIYIYIINKGEKIKNELKSLNNDTSMHDNDDYSNCFYSLWNLIKVTFQLGNVHFHDNDSTNTHPIITNIDDLQENNNNKVYQNFIKRKNEIRKKTRLIFIYPISYIFLWIFPLILDITQYKREIVHGPILWLSYIVCFVLPFNGAVDSTIFFIREKPWNLSFSKIETIELIKLFTLKGELGEFIIRKYYHSNLGKKGLYYRGNHLRKKCWKYNSNFFKKICWFIYKFLINLFSFKSILNFNDNCNNDEYWLDYYNFPQPQQHSSSNNDTTESSSMNYDNDIPEEVPLFYQFIRLFPMLKGVDLDEIDRTLRLNSINSIENDNDYLPGLNYALKNINDSPNKKFNLYSSQETFHQNNDNTELQHLNITYNPNNDIDENSLERYISSNNYSNIAKDNIITSNARRTNSSSSSSSSSASTTSKSITLNEFQQQQQQYSNNDSSSTRDNEMLNILTFLNETN